MKSGIPTITVEQMRVVNYLLEDYYGISMIQTIENAAIHLSRLALKRFLRGKNFDKKVFIFAGRGGNGSAALACSRHLCTKGVAQEVFLSSSPKDYTGSALQQLKSLQRLGVSIRNCYPDHYEADLIIDGLIGYGLNGKPRGLASDMINWTHGCGIPILSLDIPSGMNGNTGKIVPPAVRSSATMTLALPKKGLFEEEAYLQIGDLFLADIGVPPQLYEKVPLIDDKIRFLFKEKTLFKIF